MKERDVIRPTLEARPEGKRYWLLPGVVVPVINMALLAGVAIWNPGWLPDSRIFNTVLVAIPLLVEWALLTVVLARRKVLSAWRVVVTLVVLVGVSFALVTFVFIPIGYGINCAVHPENCQT